jgi:uncharacterized protein
VTAPRRPLPVAFLLLLTACGTASGTHASTQESTPAVAHTRVAVAVPEAAVPASPSPPVVARARLEVVREVSYDPAWFAIAYPNGDPAPDRGVCTDVVIRSLRTIGIDLQQRVHEDILRRPAVYTTVTRPDRNIDHRRVTPMLTYLRTHATSLPTTFGEAELVTWEPGDIVVLGFRPCPACTPDHVGIVSDRKGPRGLPLLLHNVGPRPSEDDRIDTWTVLGHFRLAS